MNFKPSLWIFMAFLSPSYLQASESPLTLNQALHELRLHPRWLKIQMDTQQVRATLSQAYASWLPDVQLSHTWAGTEFAHLQANQTSARASLALWQSGARFFELKQQHALVKAQDYKKKDSQLDLEEELVLLFFKCLKAQKDKQQAEIALDWREKTYKVIHTRFERGVEPRYSLSQVEIEKNRAEIDLLHYQLEQSQCLQQLGYWLSSTPELLASEGLDSLPEASSLQGEVNKHLAYLYESRRSDSVQASYRKTLANFGPKFVLAWQESPSFDYQSYDRQWLLEASWTVFDWDQQWSARQIASLEMEIQQTRQQEKLRQLKKEAKNLSDEREIKAQALQISKKNRALSQNLLSVSLKRYEAGLININDLLLDQGRMIQASYTLNQIWLEAFTSHYRWQYFAKRVRSKN